MRGSSAASSSRRISCLPTWWGRASTTRRPASSRLRSGPVFSNLLLADEINRAPAKVQSALLEVMQEHQVTIAGETLSVPEPFLVMATQNPIETEGTYALPEAQVDRFMMKVLVGYPTEEEEFVIVERVTGAENAVAAVSSTDELAGAAARVPRRVRRSLADQLRGQAGRGDAQSRARGLPGPGAVSSPSAPQPRAGHPSDRGRARAGLPARPRLTCCRRTSADLAPTCCATAWCCPTRRWPRHHAPTRDPPFPAQRSALRKSRWKPMSSSARTPEAILRRLEWTVMRRLDGLLHGDYRTPVPRHRARSRRPARVPVSGRRAPHRLERHRAPAHAVRARIPRGPRASRPGSCWTSARRWILAPRPGSAPSPPSSSRCSRGC